MTRQQSEIRLSKDVQKLLRCPVCLQSVTRSGQRLACTNTGCGLLFPIVNGIPVLLNEAASVFSIDDFTSHRNTYFPQPASNLTRVLDNLLPKLSKNFGTDQRYKTLLELALNATDSPRVLVIGGGVLGLGIPFLQQRRLVELVETDVSIGPRTQLVCDAHNLPFQNESFDAVIGQAVLEHVVDPYTCADEIHRVLKSGGLVYAETPFMQQVHGGPYDFTRFTHLGHRRLFRKFDEIESGAAAGAGVALAWSLQYFLFSLTRLRLLRQLFTIFSRLAFSFLKYVDYFVSGTPATLDAASSFYFLGRKGSHTLTDRELIKLYKGANRRR